MPWWLIKDKVEIDNQLISCAEYQLFIDHQSKIGQNPRPNHWTTERFPRGMAKIPITGIKASDADAFCLWLNEQHPSLSVKYRLPTLTEIETYPLQDKEIGYWCSQGNTWVIGGIEPLRWQNWQTNLFQVLNTAIAFDFFRTLERYFNRIADLDIAIILTLDQANLRIGNDQSQEAIFKARNHSMTRVREVARNLARNLAVEQTRLDQITSDLDNGFFFEDSLLCDLLRTRATELEEKPSHDSELLLDIDLALDIDLKYQGQLKKDLTYAQTIAKKREGAIAVTRRLYRILRSDLAKKLTEKFLKLRQLSKIINQTVELDFEIINKLETELKQVVQPLRHLNHSRIRAIEQVIQDAGDVDKFDLAEVRYYLLLIAGAWYWLSEIYKKAASTETATTKKTNKYQDLSQEYQQKSDEVLQTYSCFVLLEERQNQRLPAWEGLRLVREWIS